MTIEEAIKQIRSRYCHGCIINKERCRALCYFELAIEALEKQIPQKPLHTHKNYYCPVCKEEGWMLWDDAIPNELDNFCGKCGQRLDWSDINEQAP